MKYLVENFQCQEYLGEKYQSGLFHPDESWEIYSNRYCNVTRNDNFLIIGQSFDEYEIEFCYRKSKYGIWALKSDGNTYFFANRLHEMVEGWHPYSTNDWLEMDTVARWKIAENFLQHHTIHYNWNAQSLIMYIQRCTELELNRWTSLIARKDRISISFQSPDSQQAENKFASIELDQHSNNYKIIFQENQTTLSSPKTYNVNEMEQSIYHVMKWLSE